DKPETPPLSAAPPVASASAATAKVEEKPAGYVPPEKKRTTPNVALLRKQLRAVLLAKPNEADEWKRDNPEHQNVILGRLQERLQRDNVQLPDSQMEELRNGLLDDLLGFGAIQPLVTDRTCSEIMINGPEIIFAERKGKLTETEIVFDDHDHIQWVSERIVRRIGRQIDREHPMTDARLPDGSRVHLIMPPSALQGTTITIRKFPERVLTPQDLIGFGSFTKEAAQFLQACVGGRLNIVVSGGTG